MATNDNETPMREAPPPPPDAHGQAALLLVESLIHGLCENSTVTAAEAVEIAERAVDVQFDRAEAENGAVVPMWHSHALLLSIAASLRIDGNVPTPPLLVR